MSKKNNKMDSFQISKTKCDIIKSKAVVKYSSVLRPANFAHLQCNTDLNLPPSNWLSSTAESYGLGHMFSHSDGFSSFQMAHMFPDCIGEVDVVSDAENIKRLLKIPYSNKSVSMMVHRIENTLLIDEFDVHKHLMVQTEDDWEWLRKFFYNHILESFDRKEQCITHKVNTFDVIQQKHLNSKFLHYSIANSSNSSNNELPNKILPSPSSSSGPPLPEPTPEEEFPDDPKTHRLFNQNVLWNFEDLRMLLGTDLPIFGGGTYPCLSLRLRDMSKPISVLTGIDYWLDNLMCNVPEVVMCYHLNGIVQKYELVKTEDLPYLNDSKFSPKVIRDVAQNILSFLKSNATKAGHTYWLFKGKNDDVVKLYDLTSLCSESLVEGRCEGQNPFTVPVAMLLYRVARNLKHNPNDGRPSSPVTIQILLNNCLKLLNKTKYPQIVTSVNYMLSDLYIPVNTNPTSPKLEDLTNVGEKDSLTSHIDSDDDSSFGSDEENPTFSVDIHDLCLSHKKEKKSKKSKFPPTEPVVKTLEERCQKALHHVGCGLSCLQFFKNLNPQFVFEENIKNTENKFKMASSEAIPMPYFAHETNQKIKKDEKVINKGVKNKNRKRNKGTLVFENDENNKDVPSTLLCKSIAETMPTWHNPPDAKDSHSWKKHLRVLLCEKACLSYAALAEHEFTCTKYGRALKHFRSVFECRLCIINSTNIHDLFGFLLGRCGDCCLLIAQNWDKAQQYTNELENDEKYDLDIREALNEETEDCIQKDFDLIPSHLESKEDLLNAAANCYARSLELETNDKNKNNLNRRIGNVYNEITSGYINEISTALRDKIELTPLRLQWLLKQSEHYLSMGIDKFENTDDLINLALLYSNMGRLYRHVSYYSSHYMISYGEFIKNEDFTNKAVESYMKGLAVLGNRRFNPQLWDMVSWDLSTTIYNMAIQSQDDPSIYSDRIEAEKEVISLLLKALKYCDLENDSSRRLLYEFRAAYIHDRLASLYHHRLRCLDIDIPKFKTTLHQCMSHYNRAFEMFFKMERPLECLEILIKTIALDELQIDSATNFQSKVKFFISIIQTLGKCVNVLKMLSENNFENEKGKYTIDNNSLGKIDQTGVDDQDSEYKKKKLLNLLEERLQFILKCMIKLAMAKISKFANKTNQLKAIYGELLRKNDKADDFIIHLLGVVTQISKLNI